MIRYDRARSKKDLEQILELQRQNLPTSLSAEERLREGFVTVSHTYDLLETMNETCPHIIAKSNDKVIGYTLCMHPKFGDEIEVLRPMFDEIKSIRPAPHNYMVMGQICIDKAFRGKGVFRQLYETMRLTLLPEFASIITEVDAENLRSLHAHYAIGFTDLKTYRAGGRVWRLIDLKSEK